MRASCNAEDEIIVSGGGSAAALPLFRLALEAARLGPAGWRWRILVGRGVAEEAFRQLATEASGHAIVERARPDFPALLAGCALSISQAGYNTCANLLETRCRAILVPNPEMSDQPFRARRFTELGLARAIPAAELEPARLAEAMAAALESPRPSHTFDLDGARRTREILEGMCGV